MKFFQRLTDWFYGLFTPSRELGDEETSEERRPPPFKSVPPSETRDHLVALAIKRENGLQFFPIWGTKDPTPEDKEALADEYDKFRPDEYLLVLSLGLFYCDRTRNVLIQTTRPDEPLTWAEAQQLGDYVFKLMNGKQGDIFLAAVADSLLGSKRCFLLTSNETDFMWSVYTAKRSIKGFQIDNPEVFSAASEESGDEIRRELPIKVKFDAWAGFVPPGQLVSAIKRGTDLVERKILTIPVPERGVLTRVYIPKYIAKQALSLAVYDFNDANLYVYNERGEPRIKKRYRGFVVNEIDEDGMPIEGYLVAIARHDARPTVARRQPSGALDPTTTPPPVKKRVTPR
jgi:hypothetical protein